VTLPQFETIGSNILKQTRTEALLFCPVVLPEQKEAWLDSANRKKDWVMEGRMQQMGSLQRLMKGDESYNNNMTLQIKSGAVVPDTQVREYYTPAWTFSPPPATYGLINMNLGLVMAPLMAAFFVLQNETLVSPVMKHPGIPIAFSPQEHAKYHSKLTDSSVENPHSFFFHPVFAKAGDRRSGISGFIASASAWDAALLHLLPEGVEGLHVVIRNN
jgi:hypothetical protein